MSDEIEFFYTNYKGQKSRRRANNIHVVFTQTAWHPQTQHIMFADDLDKGERRGFALKDCDFTCGGGK